MNLNSSKVKEVRFYLFYYHERSLSTTINNLFLSSVCVPWHKPGIVPELIMIYDSNTTDKGGFNLLFGGVL